ncbi:MAG TPA: PTS sugar transporter subunit IIA [Selenomonadales bacterium]|nr:PTS sugar transporter subunit IIA [Selenomonadales bacterium]
MGNATALLDEELICMDCKAKGRQELLRDLAGLLYEKGYVKDGYADAIWEREEQFPTGLATKGIQVAIPHTDAKFVNKPAILVAKLKKPVVFKEMGSEDKEVEASMVFMLALNSHDEQLDALSKLTEVFSDESVLRNLYSAPTAFELLARLKIILG